MARLYIGTSGWSYPAWKESFYGGRPQKEWLGYYSTRFPAVELNASFYRLQKPETFKKWHDDTPPDFRFTMKANRYLTHNKKLKDPLPSIRIEKSQCKNLGEKLAAVLWQLPGNYKKHLDRLEAFAVALKHWTQVRHVIEFRHPSWFDDEVAGCLHKYRIANCISDAADWPLWEAVTTNLVYIRLHGHTRTYASAYRTASLKQWATKIRKWLEQGKEVHVYFDNDGEGAAPRDAKRLLGLLR